MFSKKKRKEKKRNGKLYEKRKLRKPSLGWSWFKNKEKQVQDRDSIAASFWYHHDCLLSIISSGISQAARFVALTRDMSSWKVVIFTKRIQKGTFFQGP